MVFEASGGSDLLRSTWELPVASVCPSRSKERAALGVIVRKGCPRTRQLEGLSWGLPGIILLHPQAQGTVSSHLRLVVQ